MVPPEPAEPAPSTVRAPAPVLLSRMPLTGPDAPVPAETLFHLIPEAPIVVLATLIALPVVVTSVLAVLVAVTVPPPVAVKASLAPVERVIWPEKLIVAPVLLFRKMPWPLPLIVLVKDLVPPVVLVTETARPEEPLMVPS